MAFDDDDDLSILFDVTDDDDEEDSPPSKRQRPLVPSQFEKYRLLLHAASSDSASAANAERFKNNFLNDSFHTTSFQCKLISDEVCSLEGKHVQQATRLRILEMKEIDTLQYKVELVTLQHEVDASFNELNALKDLMSELWENESKTIVAWSTATPLSSLSAIEDEDYDSYGLTDTDPEWYAHADSVSAAMELRDILWLYSVVGGLGKTRYITKRTGLRIQVNFESNMANEMNEICKQICDAVDEELLDVQARNRLFFDLPRGKKIPNGFLEILEGLLQNSITHRKYKGKRVTFAFPPKLIVLANAPPSTSSLVNISPDRLMNTVFLVTPKQLLPDRDVKVALSRLSSMQTARQEGKIASFSAHEDIGTLFEKIFRVDITCMSKQIEIKAIRERLQEIQNLERSPQAFKKELFAYFAQKYGLRESQFVVEKSRGHICLSCVVTRI